MFWPKRADPCMLLIQCSLWWIQLVSEKESLEWFKPTVMRESFCAFKKKRKKKELARKSNLFMIQTALVTMYCCFWAQQWLALFCGTQGFVTFQTVQTHNRIIISHIWHVSADSVAAERRHWHIQKNTYRSNTHSKTTTELFLLALKHLDLI